MSAFFAYKDGRLQAEAVPLAEIARAVGTPFYCYSTAALRAAHDDHVQALSGLDATLCYAMKANSNLAVVRCFAERGAGADVVSEGELRQAIAAGVPPNKIVFAGVGKTPEEMAAGLDAGILQFNVESVPELETLNRVAAGRGQRAPVALRVNPDVDAKTHAKISTGKAENKFGIDLPRIEGLARRAMEMPGIAPEGLAVHIGSQLTDLAPFEAAFGRLIALYRELRAAGVPLRRLDFGGGLGVSYRDERPPEIRAYGAMVRRLIGDLEAELVFEPGRALTADAGVLVARTLYVKEGSARRFVILDAAMNDLIRPAMYDAWHDMLPLRQPAPGAEQGPFDVVGPICESSDTFAKGRILPTPEAGDLLAICSAGAYGAVMASSYNARRPAAEVLVNGADFAVVRPRPDYAAILGQDRLPPWLAAPAVPARGPSGAKSAASRGEERRGEPRGAATRRQEVSASPGTPEFRPARPKTGNRPKTGRRGRAPA